ncbi:MAG: TonB-dependent receptor [Prolixibacteraceae bacterium]
MKKNECFFREWAIPEVKKVLRTMKLAVFLLLISVIGVFASKTYSQTKVLNLNITNSTIKEVLQSIEAQSGYYFMYSEKLVDVNRKVSINIKNENIEEVLDRLFAGTNVNYKIKDHFILLARSEAAKELAVQQQPITISGRVSDSSGQPLSGVTVAIKGTSKGTITDAGGAYSLVNVPAHAVLAFSFIGMETREIFVDDRTTYDITLKETTVGIDEVVAIAYGKTTQRTSTGAMQKIDSNELKDIPAAQFTQKIQGKLAGVEISQNSGKPGQGIQVRVRGSASISTASVPLYVVDGFPIVGDINNIDPNEIESITILKDAASTALYGSRAAFGVVLVTTKSAKAGQTNISVNAYTGLQQVPQKGRPDMMNGAEWAQFKKEYYEDLRQTAPEAFQNPSQYGKGTDWYDAMLRTGEIGDYNVSISTNKDKLSNSFTAGFFTQKGVVLHSDYQRISIRNNAVYKAADNVKVGVNLAPTYNYGNNALTDGFFGGSDGLLANAMLTPPILNYKNADGTLPVTVTTPGITAFNTPNWVRSIRDISFKSKTNRLLSNLYVEYEPVAGLILKSAINFELGEMIVNYFQPSTASLGFASTPSAINARLGENNKNYYSWLSENTASYSRQIKKHNFDILAGYTVQKYKLNETNVSGSNFPDDRIRTIDAALVKDKPRSDIQEWSLISYLTRLNYNYDQKYLFSFSMRRDGSSRFGANNKWGNFPAVSVGWVASEESFADNIPTLSFLKIRGSYGLVGNNNIGNYTQYATVASAVNSPFGSNTASGVAVTNLGNSELGWETTKELDLGVDIGVLKNRISFTYDYYSKKTSNLLFSLPVPVESGFSSFPGNIGEIKFWGHEFTINSNNMVGKFKWNTGFNISFSNNKVLKLSGLSDAIYTNTAIAETVTKVGDRVGQFYGFIQDGVYVDQADYDNSPKGVNSQVGTIKFKDLNGDKVIKYGDTDGDKTIIGNPYPEFIFGLTNSLSYQNFDLSVVATGAYGNDIASVVDAGTTNLDGVFNVLKEVKNRWRSPENPGEGKYGKTMGSTADERSFLHTRFIQDGSYLTIKNITLGYNFPVNNWKVVKSLRLYCSVQQAFVFTKYKGANPEIGTDSNGNMPNALLQGLDYSAYPVPRTFSFGLNLNLK